MATKKKDLEIIYNLQWKNKTTNGGDKANVIGMYDIPATTLNWEIFKSYLLKNSGTIGDDVKVSYITDSNREFPIESQTDFQIALYAFRRKARLGDIVNLKLDRISNQPTHKNVRHSNDVETQFDNNEALSLVSTCCNSEIPPDWFITYMNQFKKNLSEELTATVSSIVSNIKPQISQPSYHTRKSKAECTKRIRKIPSHLGENSHETKDLIKSLKLEGKLERKLEKLEHKTKKIKEKKLALFSTKSSDSEAGHSSSRSRSNNHCESEEDLLQMDAIPMNSQTIIPHMVGGEIYLHQWEVMNTGKNPWTSKTSLNFAWGSKALKPLESIISVPFLKPGETGMLAVRLQIPNSPGQYQCYWHFYHKDRRFGHWLGCQVIVDPFDLKGNKSVLEGADFIASPEGFQSNYSVDDAVTHYFCAPPGKMSHDCTWTPNYKRRSTQELVEPEQRANENDVSATNNLDMLVRDISAGVEDIKLQDPTDTNCSSDSDNQSVVSLTESNSSKNLPEEFVIVPIPDCFKVDVVPNEPPSDNTQLEINTGNCGDLTTDCIAAVENNVQPTVDQLPDSYDNNNNTEETNELQSPGNFSPKVKDDVSSSDGSHKSDIVIVSLPEEKEGEEYAFIIVDGQKLPIPKKVVKSEYLKVITATPGPSKSPVVEVVEEVPVQPEYFEEPIQPERIIEASDRNLTNSERRAKILEDLSVLQEYYECFPQFDIEDQFAALNDNNPYKISKPEESANKAAIVENGSVLRNVTASEEHKIITQNTNIETNDLLSHCSAAGSSFSEVNSGLERDSRLFVFPQNCPGYEVIASSQNLLEIEEEGLRKLVNSDTHTYTSGTPLSSYGHNQLASSQSTVVNSPPLNLSTHDRNPFTAETTVHVPNYQQTPPSMRAAPLLPETSNCEHSNQSNNISRSQSSSGTRSRASSIPENGRPCIPQENPTTVHILPETLVTGAVNVASSAISTARSVINMIVPREQPGRWVNGHWVSTNPETPREANLQSLAEMGFWNRDLNASLLARYNDDLSRVVAELVQ